MAYEILPYSNGESFGISSNKKLVEEIEDGFLICPLCSEQFKRPKILACLHTFCCSCLEDQHEEEITSRKYYDPREITCPLCKKKCAVPVGGVRGLSDNHLVLNLSEVVAKRKEELRKEEEEPSCEVCNNDFDFDQCEELKKDIVDKRENFAKRNSVPAKVPTERIKSGKKRRKSFMSAGLVLRSSAYDEPSKANGSLMEEEEEEEEEEEATEEMKSEEGNNDVNNWSSSGVSSTSTSSRNTQSTEEKGANINNNIQKNNKNDRRATSKCLECNKLLCGNCVERHHSMKVTSGHCLIDIDTQKDVLCKEHPGEAVRFFCEECAECVCVLCAFNKHRSHKVETFAEAASRQRNALIENISSCKDKTSKLEEDITNIKSIEENFKKVETEIRERSTNAVMKIRARERELVDELYQQLGPCFIEYQENKDHFNLQLETMNTTINLAEMVIETSDVEMLLLKREVDEKLKILSQASFKHAVSPVKPFTFIPGSVHLGDVRYQ